MEHTRSELEGLDRESLVLRAQAAGIRRARVLTRPELIDELLRLDPTVDEAQLRRTRGFFGRARDLLSRVVERGLHLPDAAERIRTALAAPLPEVPRPEPQAVPTVTLAEIYAAQGHRQRAIDTARRVLEVEPDHGAARALLERLEASDYVPPAPPLPPEADEVPPAKGEIGANLGRGDDDDDEPRARADEPDPEVADPAAAPAASAHPANPRDECVAIPLGVGVSYVWWRLSPEGTARLAGGRFVIRTVVLVPTWDGPQQATRDIPFDAAAGETVLRGLPPRAVVRVAVGYGLESGDFVPLAHSPALEATASRGLVRWTLEGPEPVRLDDPRAGSIACAVESAARIHPSRG